MKMFSTEIQIIAILMIVHNFVDIIEARGKNRYD